MPCSLQSTAHSLCSATPLVCSTLALLVISLALLVVSLVQLSAADLRLQRRLSLCRSVVLSKSPLSLGSLPSFQFPLCRRLYRHSGLSDRRLKTPYLARCSTIVSFDLLSLPTTPLLLLLDLVGLLSLLSIRELIIDSRTPTTSRTLSLYAA